MGPSMSAGIVLSADAIDVLAGRRALVEGLTLEAQAGEIVAVLGRNGTGKTLTLHTLAGLRPPRSGSVRAGAAPIGALPRRSVARHIGVLFQDLDIGLSSTAFDAVLLGRYPHLAAWQWETDADRRIAREALERVGLAALASRQMNTLSGGEQRRVALAALLAQSPQVFALDEPTNHLDPHHQLAVFRVLRELAGSGRTVIATLHDPTLAARFADRALLLYGDGRWKLGPVGEVLTEEILSELYLTPFACGTVRGHRVFVST
jgi:iron complex transport system ATP-binding protein